MPETSGNAIYNYNLVPCFKSLVVFWEAGLLVTTTSGAVLNLFQVLYWFIGVGVRKPQIPPYTSIQRYKLQPKHDIETSPAGGRRDYTTLHVKSKKLVDVREGSLLTLELKRAYYVLVRDSRVSDLITWYFVTLQKAIDIIWDNIRWELRKPKLVRRNGTLQTLMGLKLHNPIIPKDERFKKMLRDELMKDNPYAAHWVDAIIRKAYSIIKSWRKRYLKGKARKAKPRIKRRFAKCKITLMKVDYKEKTIRITMKPHEYLEVSWRGTWFEKRVEGWLVGEVTLKDNRIIIPFKNYKVVKIMDIIGWDSNELELTGYTLRIGFIHLRSKTTTKHENRI